MTITYYGEHGKKLWQKKITDIGHYGIIRDYTVTFKDKTYLLIDADTIKAICEHEAQEKDEA